MTSILQLPSDVLRIIATKNSGQILYAVIQEYGRSGRSFLGIYVELDAALKRMRGFARVSYVVEIHVNVDVTHRYDEFQIVYCDYLSRTFKYKLYSGFYPFFTPLWTRVTEPQTKIAWSIRQSIF